MSTTLTRPAPPREVPTPPAQVQQSSPNRLRRVLSFLAGLLAVGLGTVVTAINFDRYPTSFDDEGTYVAQAWALQHLGHLAHYTYWYDHPPVGWIQLAGWTSLTGAFDRAISGVAAGRELMIIIHAISCVLIWLICRELRANVVWSSLAVLLYSFSPLAIYFHRMVLLDNFSAVWLLLTLLMLVRRKRTLAWCAPGDPALRHDAVHRHVRSARGLLPAAGDSEG
jgi:4-amino-4-deoxy-L-arabinose transferase-like glycosyltransferase